MNDKRAIEVYNKWRATAGRDEPGAWESFLYGYSAASNDCKDIITPFAEIAKYAKGKPDDCWCGQAPAVIRYRDLTAALEFLNEKA